MLEERLQNVLVIAVIELNRSDVIDYVSNASQPS
jgi:hypothetical protein